MRHSKIFATAIALAVFAIASASGTAAAELSDLPQTSWGVSGLASGTQSDNIEAEVFAIEEIAGTMFVGGRFLDVTDGVTTTSQASLAAFDATTGDWVSTFTPNINGAVNALAASPDGTRLFVGGDFTIVNGVTTQGLVALDPLTGAIDATWTGHIGGYNLVRDFEISDGWLYVGGGFTSVSSNAGGNAADRVARFAITDGAHDSTWLPAITGGSVWGIAASPTLDRIYLAGTFDGSNGVAAPGGFATIAATTPTNVAGLEPFPVNTQNVSAQYNFDIVVTNGLVFVAGSQHYLQVLNESDLSLEVFHLSSVRGDYQSLVVDGDRVYAGCHCFGGTTLESSEEILWVGPRPDGVDDGVVFHTAVNGWLAAFDAATGLHIDDTTPAILTSGAGIWGMAVASDSCLWAGGAVTAVGGTAQYGFTRLCDESTIDIERPTPPTALQASTPAGDTVVLTWNASTDDFGVTGYNIYDAVTDTLIEQTMDTTFEFSGLAEGTYAYSVRATDAAGNVSWRSNIVLPDVADTQRPTPPTAFQVTISGIQDASLSWGGSSDDVEVAGYYVYDAATDLIIGDTTALTSSLTGLSFDTHQFYVQAYDAAGNISWRSNIATITLADPAIDIERPTPPTAFQVTVTGVQDVSLSWGGSTDNLGVAGYYIYDANTDLVIGDSTTLTASFTGLSFDTHQFYVQAYDAAGNISWRSNIAATTLADPGIDIERPSTPTALMGTISGTDSVDLTWNASTDNFGVAGYYVYDQATDLIIADVATNSVQLTGLVAGTQQFAVRAYDAAGNVSWRTNVVMFMLP